MSRWQALCSPEDASEGIEIGRYENRAVEGATLMMFASVEVAGFAAACSIVTICLQIQPGGR